MSPQIKKKILFLAAGDVFSLDRRLLWVTPAPGHKKTAP